MYIVASGSEAAKLDAYWTQMRLAKSQVWGLSLIRDGVDVPAVKSLNVMSEGTFKGPTLLDALGVYLEQKGNGKAKSFRQSAERACGYVIENCGNKPLAAYTRVMSELTTFPDIVPNISYSAMPSPISFRYFKTSPEIS